MAYWFEYTANIDSRDTDCFGLCRPSALLAYLQEGANVAAEDIEVSREEMLAKYHCFWMLVRIWYRLDQPIRQFDRITFKTWHRGDRGAIMHRDFDILREGERIGEVVSAWVLADWDTRRIFRLSKAPEFSCNTGGELCKEISLRRLKLPEHMTLAQERVIAYSDLDVNGHVNNTKYADFLCDALQMEHLGQGRYVSELQIGYEYECRAGEALRIFIGEDGGRRLIRGDDRDGKNRFEAAAAFSPLPEEGQ